MNRSERAVGFTDRSVRSIASRLNADVLGARTSRSSMAVSLTLLIEIARLELAVRDFESGADFFEACLRDFGVMTSRLAAWGSWQSGYGLVAVLNTRANTRVCL